VLCGDDMAQELSSREDFAKLVEDHDFWLFDCDGQPVNSGRKEQERLIVQIAGVIWHGDRLIDGVVDFLKYLRSKGKTCIFVTCAKHLTKRDQTAVDIDP
jgi:4-nitrophenyl phosphatase